jgi:hypothetical protein
MELHDLLTGAYDRPDKRQTIGGIIRMTSGEFSFIGTSSFSAAEIQGFVHEGLLARDGQWVEITGPDTTQSHA